jgi:hypothetical protein
MKYEIKMIWTTTTSWDKMVGGEINVNYIIK